MNEPLPDVALADVHDKSVANVLQKYKSRIAALDQEVQQYQGRDGNLTRCRGALLLAFLALLVIGLTQIGPKTICLTAAAVVFTALLGVAGYHESLLQRLRVVKVRLKLQGNQRDRYLRKWSDLPADDFELPVQHQGVARDLDLFGAGSLYQFTCRAHTLGGREMLRDWFLVPAELDEIELRQEAVQRLSQESAMRDELELHASMLVASDTGPAAIIQWAESGPEYVNQPIRRWLIRLLTALMIVLPVAILAGWLPAVWAIVVYAIIGVNVLVNGLFVGRVHDLFNRITAGKNELFHYTALFEIIDALPAEGQKLTRLREQLNQNNSDFRSALTGLRRIMQLGSGRRSSTFGIPYVFAQILWYWDFHVLERLERWQVRHGESVRHWFASVSELEALCSLATVAADQPQWSFPKIDPAATSFQATELGHPLLPVESCCRNSVTVGPPATFLLVTGSNMSGKSTLLRSIGVNAVLAQAGGPVCATDLRMPRVELATSMRVTDSLNDGVSFFFAELRRLKEIVDRSAATTPGRRLLYLLDEILQGTNSAERHIAVAKVIDHLLAGSAIGAVSTHDLELADADGLKQRCETVHFREQFTEEAGMSFDYRLREGVSPTTNALKLLELVGLKDPHGS